MTTVLADAHVHFYPCFDHETFFDSALANFRRSAADLSLVPSETYGCLLLTEAAGARYFRQWRESSTLSAQSGWHFQRTKEDCSLLACREGGERLVVVAGRQIATSDGLEILALCYDGEFPEGVTVDEALAAVQKTDALAVIAWGFGKWLFRRGKVVAELLDSSRHPDLFVGDNGNRLGAAPPPRLFRRAGAKGMLVLPGSDPLPFPQHCRRPGSYGFALRAEIDLQRPAEQLSATLRAATQQPPRFGRLETLGPFVRYQLAMQRRKRGMKRS